MTKSRMIFATALVALVAFGLFLSPANALAKSGKHQDKAKGTITAIDTTANTVTIHDAKSALDVIVNVDDSTVIHLDNKQGAALTDLAVGDKAHARYNTTTMVAKRIQAKSPKVVGTISAINGNAVTIQPATGDPVTVNVTDATKLERNVQDATLADLVVGDTAMAKYNPQTMDASKLSAEGQ